MYLSPAYASFHSSFIGNGLLTKHVYQELLMGGPGSMNNLAKDAATASAVYAGHVPVSIDGRSI